MFPDRRTPLSKDEVRSLYEQQMAAMPGQPEVGIAFGVACEVAMIILGERIFRAVFGTTDSYLSPSGSDVHTWVHTNRVIQLGRHLLECQSVENFDSMREDLVPRTFAGVAHEVRCAAIALRTGHPVRFIKRTGVRGDDFDFLVDGRVAIEAKAKNDSTPYSVSSLKSTLRKARGQLPKAVAGVVMVAVPDSWGEEQGFRADLEDVTSSFFRQTGRVNGVVVLWDEYVPLMPTGYVCIRHVRRFENPSPRHPGGNDVMLALGQQMKLDRISGDWLASVLD